MFGLVRLYPPRGGDPIYLFDHLKSAARFADIVWIRYRAAAVLYLHGNYHASLEASVADNVELNTQSADRRAFAGGAR